MALGTGANVSKLVGYALLSWDGEGDLVSKPVGYALLDWNHEGDLVSKPVGYALLVQANPPIWPDFVFAVGVVGVSYYQSFDLYPSSPTVTFTQVGGVLPPGLSVINVTGAPSGAVGALSGVPTTVGSYTFTLRATNIYGYADKTFTLVVVSAATRVGGSWTRVS